MVTGTSSKLTTTLRLDGRSCPQHLAKIYQLLRRNNIHYFNSPRDRCSEREGERKTRAEVGLGRPPYFDRVSPSDNCVHLVPALKKREALVLPQMPFTDGMTLTAEPKNVLALIGFKYHQDQVILSLFSHMQGNK